MERRRITSFRPILFVFGVITFMGGFLLAYPVAGQPTGMQASGTTRTVSFSVEGMTCGSCVARVKRAVLGLDGVTRVDVSLEERRARVEYIEGKVSPDSIAAAVRKLGYKAGETVEETGK